MSKQLFRQVSSILEDGFVFTKDVAEILSLGLAGGKNVLIFGPGGHAKSEMVQAVISGLELDEETFFQFFGEGMDEAKLFGGLDFAKLETDKVLEYHPERSFLNFRIAVFEELFDAPANVLLALKDALTAKALRNGAQRFSMKTEVIIVLTNKSPQEIAELGASANALTERFPLQLELKWKKYDAGDYAALFEKVQARLPGPTVNGFKAILAEILAKATAEGNFVSPRTAVHAFQVCQTAARLRGADEVSQEDLTKLRFVPGLEGLAETIEEDLKAAMARAEADELLSLAEAELTELKAQLAAVETPIKALVVAKKLLALGDEVSNLRVPDGFTQRRQQLRDAVARLVSEAQSKALDTTRLEGVSSRRQTNTSIEVYGYDDEEDDEEFKLRRPQLPSNGRPSSPFGKR
jgi:MoxR-like ATPase